MIILVLYISYIVIITNERPLLKCVLPPQVLGNVCSTLHAIQCVYSLHLIG